MDQEWLKSLEKVLTKERHISIDDLMKAQETVRELGGWLKKVLPFSPQTVSNLSYEMAISYFIQDRPTDERVVKGAMLLQDHPQGKLLTQLFLDKNNDLVCDQTGKPYGRRLIVENLDNELRETFGDKDIVVVE